MRKMSASDRGFIERLLSEESTKTMTAFQDEAGLAIKAIKEAANNRPEPKEVVQFRTRFVAAIKVANDIKRDAVKAGILDVLGVHYASDLFDAKKSLLTAKETASVDGISKLLKQRRAAINKLRNDTLLDIISGGSDLRLLVEQFVAALKAVR